MSVSEPSSSSRREYVFNRDWLSSARLSVQHFTIKMRHGWLIHPTIKSYIDSHPSTTEPDAAPLRIADVAAGNCIWSIEVLSELPRAEITAFDISTQMFPAPTTRSSRLTLEQWDFFDAPPAQHRNAFDIVHVRYLASVLYEGGKELALTNMLALLKPGGWIQWQDVAFPVVAPVDLQSETLDFIPRDEWPMPLRVLNGTGFIDKSAWINGLDAFVRDVGGCEDTEIVRVAPKRDVLRYECDLVFWLFHESMRHRFGNMKGNAELERQKVEFEGAVEREIELVAKGERAWSYCVVVAVGRKPGGE